MKIYRIASGFTKFEDMEYGTSFLHPWHGNCYKQGEHYLLTKDKLKVLVEDLTEKFVVLE